MVIPTFVEQAIKNSKISIYGNGDQTRCFCSVIDVVDALIRIINNSSSIGEIINIGTNHEISINDLAEKIIKIANSNSKPFKIPYDEAYSPGFEDMMRRVPDISKAKKILGWEPKQNLDDIIISVINYYNRSM